MITVDTVSKKFGARMVLDRVAFSVGKGEVLGLLGPNGAGKTTMMRIITGFMPPSEGRVSVAGLDVFENPDGVKRKIGYLPEQPPLYLDMTAGECLAFIGEMHGLKGARLSAAVERAAGACGIAGVLGRLTGNLSKGFRQRVGLAQALIHDPEVLVLDEPTVGLDPRQNIEIRELIRLMGRERTVIVSSHILSEITQIAERVAILNEGRLIAVDTIEALSRQLGAERRVLIRTARPERIDLERLSALAGVHGAARAADNGVEVVVRGGDETLEAVSSAVVGMGAGLIGMQEAGMTLEDIFLNVLAGEKRQ